MDMVKTVAFNMYILRKCTKTMERCVVCQESILDSEAKSTTGCSHTFHTRCLLSSVRNSDTCPVCRAPLVDREDGVDTSVVDLLPSFTLVVAGEASLSAEEEAFAACEVGNVSRVKSLVQSGLVPSNVRQETTCGNLLHAALFSDADPLIQYLVREAGVSVNETDVLQVSPLHLAVLKGKVSLVRLFLGSGAFVDVRDAEGKSPLSHACIGSRIAIVKLLIDEGASTRDTDQGGNTALHHAIGRGECAQACVKMVLRERNTDVNAQNTLGDTALHLAISTGCQSLVKRLLRHGADPDIRNRVGRQPKDCLTVKERRSKSERIRDLLSA
ncbi:putative ubiquitin ligase/ankyrin repeat protein [Feldmannia species virus]|uniref:Putative ubiquitin ligase/ankyrin repeat protein n=1 Tax=Feldmannia species virus TaxID=39420 RepID=B5LWJ8_9PHYC|nr:putative ubiquitin ligase/ankyrin repeat protein [Feldmannia species virus]ACH46861.1 putative ubiquitin ligase/ankyrin repeat protein [Feldmannia species virus]